MSARVEYANITSSTSTVSTNVSGNKVGISGDFVQLNQNALSGLNVNVVGGTITAASNISGQVVRLADILGSGLSTTTVGGIQYLNAWISGQAVTTTVNTTTNISGQVVQISGQTVQVTGNLTSNVSGQVVVAQISGVTPFASGTTVISKISGETIQIAGGVNVSGATVNTNVSGNVLYTTSGKNDVQISGQTIAVSNFPATTSSNVSGNVVYLTSGQNAVQVSGQLLSVSGVVNVGNFPTSFLTSVSGNIIAAQVSGVTPFASGTTVIAQVSGQTIQIAGGVNVSGAIIYLTSGFNTAQISGQLVSVSGIVNVGNFPTSFLTSVSGNIVVAQVSGQSTFASGTTHIAKSSGQVAYLVNDQLNNIVWISGQSVNATLTFPSNAVSGNVIYTTSGKNDVQISGQTIAVSSLPVVSISGNSVGFVSGNLGLSGLAVTTSIAVNTNVSGNVVYLTSGNNTVQDSGQTFYLSNDQIHNVVWISGQSVTAALAFPANAVSGNVVYTTSGFNTAQISGQLVAVSGLVNVGNFPTSFLTSISGNNIYTVSGSVTQISGQTIAVSSLPVISQSGNVIVAQISGQSTFASGTTIIALTSGQINPLPPSGISGNVIVAQISGAQPFASGTTIKALTSGQVSYFVNDQINNIVWISGQSVATTLTFPASAVSGNVVVTQMSGTSNFASGTTVHITDTSGNSILPANTISYQTINFVPSWVSGQYVNTSGTPIKEFGPPTYMTYTEQPLLSGKIMYLMNSFYSGEVHLKQLLMKNVETNPVMSGAAVKFDVVKLANVKPAQGTPLTAITFDGLDNASGALLFMNVSGVQASGGTQNIVNTYMMNTTPLTAFSGVVSPSLANQITQKWNIIDEVGFQFGMKDWILRSGDGIALMQTSGGFGYGQTVSGRFGIRCVYTVET